MKTKHIFMTLGALVMLISLSACSSSAERRNQQNNNFSQDKAITTQRQKNGLNKQGHKNSQNNQGKRTKNQRNEDCDIQYEETAPLTQEEINGLLLMREEEKLARDVYLTLYKKWGQQIFNNIASSEQKHTDAVKRLLEHYNIEDPVQDDTIGVFTSVELAKLYTDLVAQGEKTLLDGLVVGATVEDLDIHDLDTLIENTNNPNITMVYENLNKGSRNHIRSFTRQITANGGEYAPQYISQTAFDNIINAEQERGNSNGGGQGNGKHHRK